MAINLTSSGGAQAAALQWSFGFSADITGVTVVAGSAAAAAQKSVSCSATTCLLYGLNTTLIENGVAALATFQLASNPSGTTIPIQISGVVAATGEGNSIPASGGSGVISLPGATTVLLSALSCSPSVLNSNAVSTCTVFLNKGAGSDTTVAVISSNAVVRVPVTSTIAANQSSGTFTASSGTVGSTQTTTITASLNGSSKAATLTVTQSVTSGRPQVFGIFNAASFVDDPSCVPGSFATLIGANFVPNGVPQVAAADMLPTNLTGLEVRINGAAVPLLFASDRMINFQCPNLPLNSELMITVKPASGPESDPIKAVVSEASPGIFMLNGTVQGAVLLAETGQIAMPITDGLPSRPATPGEFLSIYCSGIGPLEETPPPGAPAPLDRLVQTIDSVTVVVGGVEVTPSFSGLAPGQVGLNQVNFKLPSGVMTGEAVQLYVKVTLADGSVRRSNTVTISVEDR